MHTWQRLGLLTLLIGCGSILILAGSPQRPTFTPEQESRLQIREVRNGLYVIPGFDGGQSGGNVAVRVTDDGVIIVDNKFPYSFDFITEQVRSVTDQPSNTFSTPITTAIMLEAMPTSCPRPKS